MSEKSILSTDEDISLSQSSLSIGRGKRKLTELRHPRQKYCPRWEEDFPWLRADKVDESIGVCLVCNKALVCKKSHLERHQNSYKHQRLQRDEHFDTDSERPTTATTEFIGCGGKTGEEDENDSEPNNKFESAEYKVEFELNPKPEIVNKTKSRKRTFNPRQKHKSLSEPQKPKLDRFKLLKCINRDRHELNDYFNSYLRKLSPTPPQPQARDSFDLFFDSVGASVKTLPPKLAAEVKSKVSQIIAEYELRAICEREAASSAAESEVVVASTTEEPTPRQSLTSIPIGLDITETSTPPPHIVYTFQTK